MKGIVVEGVVLEAEGSDDDNKKRKTYSTLGKLTNLGKTFFINWGEVKNADAYAQNQILQKFGAAMVGSDGVKCEVSYFMELPDKQKKLKKNQ